MMVARPTASAAARVLAPRILAVQPLHCPAFETTASMQRSTERILTTHVGSLIRPREIGAESRRSTRNESADACLREAVAEVVAHQARIGLDIVNDGEYGKSSWANYILERVSGFETRANQLQPIDWLGRDRERFADFFAQEMPAALTGMPAQVCVGPIEYKDDGALGRAIADLKHGFAATDAKEAFMTVVAPASAAYNGVNEHYASDRDYVFALADALRSEYLAVHAAGLVLQVDDAVLANMYDSLVRQNPARYREWAQLRVDALNHALRGIPSDRVRYHVCFGSWHVPHVADAPLEEIIDLVLQVNAQAYSIEAANVRHEHEWRVWENARLPAGKILIPGVVTHHTISVEHPRLVADRIVRFARLVGRENVIAGTDCGFSQTNNIERVHPSVMWAKLEALVEGARLASAELY
jgi:5-methyltetrahydropteroyltriglutamate--homocysteine methyltransferase